MLNHSHCYTGCTLIANCVVTGEPTPAAYMRIASAAIRCHAATAHVTAASSLLRYSKMASSSSSLPTFNWHISADDIKASCDAIQAESKAVLDTIAGALPSGGKAACSWDAVISPLVTMDRDLEPRVSSLTFLKDVATGKEVRDASTAACAALSAYEVAAGMRVDVFQSVDAFASSPDNLAGFDAESKRFVEHVMRDYRRRGLSLPEAARKEVEALRTKISTLCVAFQQALAEDATTLHFTADELAGLPADFIASLAPAAAVASGEAADDSAAAVEGAAAAADPSGAGAASAAAASDPAAKLVITMAYPHVVPILKLCTVHSTRAAVERAFNSRAHPANTLLLEEIAELRRKAAGVLGYPSHAAFVLADRMAGDTATVEAFLNTLRRDLAPLHAADLATLSQLQLRVEGHGPLTMSDYRRFQEIDLQERYAVDGDALKAYFPLNVVLTGMLGIYETLLSVKFNKLEGDDVKAHVWHEDVSLYEVLDASNSGSSTAGSRIGFFYLDMHPREGKYTHAAVFPLLSGCESGPPSPSPVQSMQTKQERVLPVCAMVCNFSKPAPAAEGEQPAPSLLRHEEVVTFFHEFGHVMHHLCSTTRYHRFASFRVEQDFVEAPSQMLENWCWTPAMLQRMSGHYKTGEPIPLGDAEKLAASKKAHQGLFNTRQVFLASLDQRLHTLPSSAESAPVDTTALLTELHDSVLRIPLTPGTNFAASFGHLAGGYDSAYYGYLWSEVYSADMFDSVFAADPLDKSAGLRYRNEILAPGGSRDAKESVEKFLGRPSNNEAFLRQKGLSK